MKFYQYPKCSTCVKARKFLQAHEIDFDDINITEQPPTISELKTMLASYGGNIRKLFNTSGMQYRELNLKDKIPTMNETEALELLNGNGMLVKRPFLLSSNGNFVGFKEADWAEALI